MPPTVKSKITGLEEVKAVFRQLPEASQTRALPGAARKGAVLLRDAIIDAAPLGTEPPNWKYGRLKDNIRVTPRVRRNAEYIKFSIHVGRAYWGMFVEFGTRFMAAQPFMRPAFYSSANAAIQTVGVELGKAVEREAKRLAGPYAKARKTLLRSRW